MGITLSWLLGTCAALARRRWVRLACLAIPLTLLVIQLSLSLLFNQCVNQATVRMLLETTGGEAREFCSSYLPTWQFAGLLAVDVLMLIAVEQLRKPTRGLLLGWRLPGCSRMIAAALLAPLLAYGTVEEFDHVRLAWCDKATFSKICTRCGASLVGKTAIPFNSLCFSIGYLRVRNMVYSANADLSRRIIGCGTSALAAHGADGLHIVVVIGETHIKHRSELYGYSLPNEPWLTGEQQCGQLVRFNNAVNCASNTTDVLLNCLNLNQPAEGECIDSCAFWPAIFKAAGWHTSFCDYQDDLPENARSQFDVSEYLFPRLLRDTLYDHYEVYAAKLDPEDFVRPTYDATTSTLSLYHLKGQHYIYRERFPETYMRFTALDIADNGRPWMTAAKRQEEADYANATLYNDQS